MVMCLYDECDDGEVVEVIFLSFEYVVLKEDLIGWFWWVVDEILVWLEF